MDFAHDTEVALGAAAALVNTAGSDGDQLPDVEALDTFFAEYGWTGRHDHSEAELRAVRALRPRLRGLWQSDENAVVELVNTLLRESRALPQLVQHDDEPYHLHATSRDAPLATRMAVEAAMAFVDVVRSERAEPTAGLRLPRLRQRPRRPLQESVEAVLRRRMRQPGRRFRLSRAQSRR